MPNGFLLAFYYWWLLIVFCFWLTLFIPLLLNRLRRKQPKSMVLAWFLCVIPFLPTIYLESGWFIFPTALLIGVVGYQSGHWGRECLVPVFVLPSWYILGLVQEYVGEKNPLYIHPFAMVFVQLLWIPLLVCFYLTIVASQCRKLTWLPKPQRFNPIAGRKAVLIPIIGLCFAINTVPVAPSVPAELWGFNEVAVVPYLFWIAIHGLFVFGYDLRRRSGHFTSCSR